MFGMIQMMVVDDRDVRMTTMIAMCVARDVCLNSNTRMSTYECIDVNAVVSALC